MNNFVVDYETNSKKGGISVTEQGLDNYVQAYYAYLVSIIGPGGEYVGSPAEARTKFPTAFWMDPQNQFIAANSNFYRRWTEDGEVDELGTGVDQPKTPPVCDSARGLLIS